MSKLSEIEARVAQSKSFGYCSQDRRYLLGLVRKCQKELSVISVTACWCNNRPPNQHRCPSTIAAELLAVLESK